MKMAKASEGDQKAAVLLCSILGDVFDDGFFPRGIDGEFADDDPTRFNPDDTEHLRALYDRLKHCMESAPGGLLRMVFGMVTVLDPANRVVDPDSSVLTLHPDRVKDEPRIAPDHAGALRRKAAHGGTPSYLREALLAALAALGEE